MNMANRLGCVPSTGTLSLIRVSALLMSVGRFLVYWVWWQTRKTLQITADLAHQPIIGVESAAESTDPLAGRA